MYLLKGGILGLIVFLVCSMGFVFVSQTRGAAGVGVNLIKALTIQQGLFWAAMAGAILIGMWFNVVRGSFSLKQNAHH